MMSVQKERRNAVFRIMWHKGGRTASGVESLIEKIAIQSNNRSKAKPGDADIPS